MIPVLSVVGRKNSGKTTLIERVVRRLSSEGVRIATVKHDAHAFEVDREGKDSWRLKHAGSRMTVLASAERIFAVIDAEEPPTLEELCARFVRGVDIVIAEGFKQGPQPKIEASRRETGAGLVASPERGLVAVASNYPAEAGVPRFDLDDIEGVANFIRAKFLDVPAATGTFLRARGKSVPMSEASAARLRALVREIAGDAAGPIEIVLG